MKQVSFVIIIFLVLFYLPSCYHCSGDQARMQKLRDDSIKNALERKYAESELMLLNNELVILRLKLENARIAMLKEKDGADKLKGLPGPSAAEKYRLQLQRSSTAVEAAEDNILTIERKIKERENMMQAHKAAMRQSN